MKGLDTNVLVRYLTQDDPIQARAATRYIEGIVERGERGFVAPVVLCEMVWVLGAAYNTPKADIVRTLEQVLSTAQFVIGGKDLVRQALDGYRTGRADFADYLIGAVAVDAGCDEVATFDRHLRDTPGFLVL